MEKILTAIFLTLFVASAFAEDLSGLWVWKEDNHDQTFSITLTKSGDGYVGTYSAVGMGGFKTDWDSSDTNKFKTRLDGSSFDYVANFSGKKGKAKILFSNNELIWQIIEGPKGEHYAPKNAILIKYKKI